MRIEDFRHPWLARYRWSVVVEINSRLCEAKSSFHGPTSDGHDDCIGIWESRHTEELSVIEAADLWREAHRTAPFCFFNGNTFAAILSTALSEFYLRFPPSTAYLLNSTFNHYVAGTIGREDLLALLDEIPPPASM